MDVLLLNESKNTDITSSADGQTCGVRYSAFEIDDEVVERQYKRKYGVFVKSGDVEKNAFTNMKRQLMGAMDIGCIAMIRLSFGYLSQVQAGICNTLVEEAGTNAVIPYRLITDFDDIRNIFLNALKREGVL